MDGARSNRLTPEAVYRIRDPLHRVRTADPCGAVRVVAPDQTTARSAKGRSRNRPRSLAEAILVKSRPIATPFRVQ